MSGWSGSSTERFSGWDIIPTQVPKLIGSFRFVPPLPTSHFLYSLFSYTF